MCRGMVKISWKKGMMKITEILANGSYVSRRPKTNLNPDNIGVIQIFIEDDRQLTTNKICRDPDKPW